MNYRPLQEVINDRISRFEAREPASGAGFGVGFENLMKLDCRCLSQVVVGTMN